MSNKQIDARDTREGNQSGMAITGTNCDSSNKRGLDVQVINNDPIPVTLDDPGASALTKVLEYNEVLNTLRDDETDVLTYIVPAGKKLVLDRVDVTGCNRAKWRLYIGGVVKEDKNTWWSDFNAEFIMSDCEISSTTIVKITSEHCSPEGPGDASATLKGVLKDE